MAIKFNDQLIVSHETEFAVRFGDDLPGEPLEIIECNGLAAAKATQMIAGGTVVSCEVYRTDWAEVGE